MLTQKELGRQAIHLAMGIILALLVYLEVLSPLALFLAIVVGFLASIITKRVRLPIFSFFLDHFERDAPKKSFPGKGMIFFFIGSLLVIQLFDKDIALAAIMVLALGDSFSHVWGAQFGQTKNIFNGRSKKLLEGTIIGIIAGFLGALIFVPFSEALLGAAAAMVAEVIKIDFNDYTLDDNLIVPLVAGTVMLLVRMYL